MLDLGFNIGGRPVRVNVVEGEQDVPLFQDWVRRHLGQIAFDTETTGLDVWKPGFRLRLAQFGTESEAWVLRVDRDERMQWLATQTLRSARRLVCHNASFDLQVAERSLGVPLRELYAKTTDTGILSRLIDSRNRSEGGHGHSLEDLTRAFIDPKIADEIKGSIARLAREAGVSKERFFREVSLDHPDYNRYAGADVILTSIIYQILRRKIPQSARSLIGYEHRLARICAQIDRCGFLLDRDYAIARAQELAEIETFWVLQAERELRHHTVYEGEVFEDVDAIDWASTQAMAAAFLDRGIRDFELTPSGQLKVDEKFLNQWADQGDKLAEAIREAKKSSKWRKTWFLSFLDNADANGRCHTVINPMQARTARMSIVGIPAQTLPAGNAFVRNCFLADPGHVIASIDYSNMELRVMASLARDPIMIRAFRNGEDLHQITADAAGVSRSSGKTGNFSKAFGGGARAIAEGAGVSLEIGQQISDAFDSTYKGVTAYAERLQKSARRYGYVESATGRRLHVDKGRSYAALNYVVQSTSRDITGAALIRLDNAGFTPYMRLPIHDEVVFSFPERDAQEMAAEAARIMTHTLYGVPIPTDPEVAGRSWGSLYSGTTKH